MGSRAGTSCDADHISSRLSRSAPAPKRIVASDFVPTITYVATFDANCPTYFAPNERVDCMSFLGAVPGNYEVCEVAGRIVAAFGLADDDKNGVNLNWIMLDPR